MESTMLIVDDGEINREVLKVLFNEHYAILEAECAEEALLILERCRENIDVVLLDLIMPGMSGIEMLKKRMEIPYFSEIPVVVISSSGAMDDQIQAFELGASDFINKPFIPEIVISRVNNVMASRRRMVMIELEAQKLKVKSELDLMTGLYNKTTSEVMIGDLLKKSKGKLVALLVIDIDNFKSVNDISGHQAGDHVIKIVADLISSLFRKTDIVGRVGGDEFIVAMPDLLSMENVRVKVNELIQIMKYKPNLTIPENVTVSIGIASNGRETVTYEEVFRKADEALYQAKEDGKARYREYGIQPAQIENDERSAVLLLSRNRSVCSMVHALIPPELKVIEALSVDELARISQEDIHRLLISYIDISDSETGSSTWEKLRAFSWIKFSDVFAICREGNMEQYSTALQYHVGDILAEPLDASAFKRRSMKHLENLGIMESAFFAQDSKCGNVLL